MEETKLTIRISRQVLEDAKRYARDNDTTVTRLVSQYLQRVSTQRDPLARAPIVHRLSGTLPPYVSVNDYKRHLVEKYDGETQSRWISTP